MMPDIPPSTKTKVCNVDVMYVAYSGVGWFPLLCPGMPRVDVPVMLFAYHLVTIEESWERLCIAPKHNRHLLLNFDLKTIVSD